MSVLPLKMISFNSSKREHNNDDLETVAWKVLSLAGEGYYLDKSYILQSGYLTLIKDGIYYEQYQRYQTKDVAMALSNVPKKSHRLTSIEMKALQKLLAERHTIPSEKIKEWAEERLAWNEENKKKEELKKENNDIKKEKAQAEEAEAVNKVYQALLS